MEKSKLIIDKKLKIVRMQLTQKQIAERLGKSYSLFTKWLNGHRKSKILDELFENYYQQNYSKNHRKAA